MIPTKLEPRLPLLSEEYVLVQAWKKTSSYIRYHNWYSDTLAIDLASVDLPKFIRDLQDRFKYPEEWENSPLRLVLAPKSQSWELQKDNWQPRSTNSVKSRLRPLAHVDLKDQVAVSAMMLCLADQVETLQGNPTQSLHDEQSRRRVISYGNRLFCDETSKGLRHRWGSAKLYRAYFHDYRTFISRPEYVATSLSDIDQKTMFVVHADLRQFYDRVRPNILADAIDRIFLKNHDAGFLSLLKAALNWNWDSRDQKDIRRYEEATELAGFAQVALPQGLVASGFFANVVLLPFDNALRESFGSQISSGITLLDGCRYVDDLRLLMQIEDNVSHLHLDIENEISTWLDSQLQETAPGLTLSKEKTKVVALQGGDRPLVRQSVKMNRIQSAVSGGFDVRNGEEIIQAIQGLVRVQEDLNGGHVDGWSLSPVPDVRDETVVRFAAARFRTTYRSIRPLLPNDSDVVESDDVWIDPSQHDPLRKVQTQQQLDDETRTFALSLIRRWIEDPSNVRVLRIAFDLWPDASYLNEVLTLLRQHTYIGARRKDLKVVAWYCIAELLRAGSTETGIVADSESLSIEIDLLAYREELQKEAVSLLSRPKRSVPWYVRQQALLFIATVAPTSLRISRIGSETATQHYQKLIKFLCEDSRNLPATDFASFAILTRRAFQNRSRAIDLVQPRLNGKRGRAIAARDPSFYIELITFGSDKLSSDDIPEEIRDFLLGKVAITDVGQNSLAEIVLNTHPLGELRNELSLLRFSGAFLENWGAQESLYEAIMPRQVILAIEESDKVASIEELKILHPHSNRTNGLYVVPTWCPNDERWRFHLGYLLRFILSGHPDFTRPVRTSQRLDEEKSYRTPESHWYQRLYGLYSGQPAFGDDWVPITDWMEEFLLALLHWPGCRTPAKFQSLNFGISNTKSEINNRIADLESRQGSATQTLILPVQTKQPTDRDETRPLRACVIQTAIPGIDDLHASDLPCDQPEIRRKHRNHLSAALAAVKRMMVLRETHKETDNQLDWLIFPELSVHPNDVKTHLIPFARAHRTTILAGLTYQAVLTGDPLVNSALWVIPEWSNAYGLQIRTRRQGKRHLAPEEQTHNSSSVTALQGFRPCQWLIGYPWSESDLEKQIWMTASVCYDATDIGLASDLRDMSDIWAIPAFNKDVKTFDQMALALHYHMFQLVIVANTGEYGGSNAYWPQKDPYTRQVFHLHGQPQASLAFLEIDNIETFLERTHRSDISADTWKHPPAGLERLSNQTKR